MQAMVLSVLRSTLIAAGAAYAAKKGLDGSAVEGIVSALVAFIAAVWGAVDKLKKPA